MPMEEDKSSFVEFEDKEAHLDHQEAEEEKERQAKMEAQKATAQSAPQGEGKDQEAGAGTVGPRQGVGEGQANLGGTRSGN